MTTDYQFLPPLLPEDFEALKTSIAERGVDVPIIVDQDGNTSTVSIGSVPAMNWGRSALGRSGSSRAKLTSWN